MFPRPPAAGVILNGANLAEKKPDPGELPTFIARKEGNTWFGARSGSFSIATTLPMCGAILPAAEVGLAVLDAGGDFADGVIAYAGRWLGGEIFVSFDKEAVSLIAAQGQQARLLA